MGLEPTTSPVVSRVLYPTELPGHGGIIRNPRPSAVNDQMALNKTAAGTLLRTALYDEHKRLGARMVPFAGYEMPVQYTGVIEEHNAVRQRAGMFDVSHMGRFEVHGPDAGRFCATSARGT